MLRSSLTVVAFAALAFAACSKKSGSNTASVSDSAKSPPVELCDGLPASTSSGLKLDHGKCEEVAGTHAAKDAGAVNDLCRHANVVYALSSNDDDLNNDCFMALLPKAQSVALTSDLATNLCKNVPAADVGTSDADSNKGCNDDAKGYAGTAAQFLASECHGAASSVGQASIVTSCYTGGIAELTK